MDTTKEYIKQCEKAEEIQKEWDKRELEAHDFCKFIPHPKGKYLIWLPSQAQLQEMLKWEYGIFNLIQSFYKSFLNNKGFLKKDIFCNTMEQLWLAFVMKEKFNKTWDGEKWTI